MKDIAEKIFSSAPQSVGPETRQKVENYLALLASTGRTGQQLERIGEAYLKEILEPDGRYSGW